MESKTFRNQDVDADQVPVLLKLQWTHSVIDSDPDNLRKAKCFSVQVASKLADGNGEPDLEVLDFGLRDEAEEVRSEAVISMPVIVLWSGHPILSHIFRKLE